MSCPYGGNRELVVARDYKILGEARVEFGVIFAYFAYRSKTRAALQNGAELRELRRRPSGENFDAPIAQIAHEPGQMQILGGVLREITKPHTLHGAGHEESLGLFRSAHGTRNCNRDAQCFQVVTESAGALEATGGSELHSGRSVKE